MQTVKASGKNIVFIRPSSHVVKMSRELPGRRKFKDGDLYVEGSGANIEVVLKHFSYVSELKIPCVDEHLGIQSAMQKTRERKLGGEVSTEGLKFKTTPYDHQLQALNLMQDAKAFGLFMEMGTGKTKILIDDLVRLYQTGKVSRVLVFAPSGVHQQWVNTELPTHCGLEEYSAVAYSSKMNKAELADLYNRMSDHEGLQILTMATPSLASKKAQKVCRDWIEGADSLIIVDESHQFKSPSAGRTKFLQALAPLAKYRRIATGTELTQGLEDLFSQMRFLSPSVLGHRSFYSFRNEFCRTIPVPGAPSGAVKIVGYQNVDKLVSRVSGITYRALKKDCLDLPEKVFTKYPVPLTDEQTRVYRELSKYMAAEIAGRVMEVPLALTLLMKLQQVVSGFVIDDEGLLTRLKTNRVQAVLDILESRKKAIVWSRFRHDLDELESALQSAGYSVGTFHGGTSAEERLRVVRPGEVDVLVANAQSAGTGLNLTHFDTAIYFSNSFNASERWQSEDRIHRIGQSNKCQYIDLVSPGTIDEKVTEALLRKRVLADSIRGGDEADQSLGEEVLQMLFDIRK